MVRLSWCHGQQLSLESAADQYLIKHTKRREQKAQILYFQKLQENKLESSHSEIKRFQNANLPFNHSVFNAYYFHSGIVSGKFHFWSI